MTPDPPTQDPAGPAQVPGRSTRAKRQEEARNFLWGTWLMLFLALSLGHDTLQGLRSGEWVEMGDVEVPWWIAAACTLGALALSVCCYVWYSDLKDQLSRQPGDERDPAR